MAVRDRPTRDWRFARSPFWLFSHAFALSVVSLFVLLGLWQLERLGQRRADNEVIEARTAASLTIGGAADLIDPDQLDFRAATATVVFVDPDFVRVANRSQGGAAGEHVVAVAELSDGSAIAVNRGFVPVNADIEPGPLPRGPVAASGWLRASVEQGRFGATDSGEGRLLPRLDTERVGHRLGRPLPEVWLQLAEIDGGELSVNGFPDPVPLPPLDEGPHRSYAVQWFIFATLGLGFYLALVVRRSTGDDRTEEPPEPA